MAFREFFFLNGVSISWIFVLNRVQLVTRSPTFVLLQKPHYKPSFYQFANVQHTEIRNSLCLVHSSRKEGMMLVKCLRQGTKSLNSALNRLARSEICVLNRVRVKTPGPHLPYPRICWVPPPGFIHQFSLNCDGQRKAKGHYPLHK